MAIAAAVDHDVACCREWGHGIAANNGATAHQLMAMFGWRDIKMAQVYTRAADQERLAASGMHLLERQEQNESESRPTNLPGGTFSGKT